jgi:hypothetical protein
MLNDDNDEDEDFSIRHVHENYGVNGYYTQYGSDYRNPNEDSLTIILRQLGFQHIHGIDLYTIETYEKHLGENIHGKWTFAEIANGCLESEEDIYDTIICSFAAHLIPTSYLSLVMIQLHFVAKKLIILTPHKRPQLLSEWGWILKDEFVHERVRARLYTSDQ